jgi:hypothetical protein
VTVEWIESDIKVTIPNLLKYKDEYSRKSGHAPDNVAPETETETEGENTTTKTVLQPLPEPFPKKPKRRNRTSVIADYSLATGEVVNTLLDVWPTRQPDGKDPIRIDVADFAARVDDILRKSGMTSMLLIDAARLYLSESKYKFRAPQYFFGAGNGDGAHWLSYARMTQHKKSNGGLYDQETVARDADLFSATT